MHKINLLTVCMAFRHFHTHVFMTAVFLTSIGWLATCTFSQFGSAAGYHNDVSCNHLSELHSLSYVNEAQKSVHISSTSGMMCASPKMLCINCIKIVRSCKHYTFTYFMICSYVEARLESRDCYGIIKIECKSSECFISCSPLFLTLLLWNEWHIVRLIGSQIIIAVAC